MGDYSHSSASTSATGADGISETSRDDSEGLRSGDGDHSRSNSLPCSGVDRRPFGYEGSNLCKITNLSPLGIQKTVDSSKDISDENPFLALDALEQLVGSPVGSPAELCHSMQPQSAENRQLLQQARFLVTQPGTKRSDLKHANSCSNVESQVDVSVGHVDLKTFALSLDLEVSSGLGSEGSEDDDDDPLLVLMHEHGKRRDLPADTRPPIEVIKETSCKRKTVDEKRDVPEVAEQMAAAQAAVVTATTCHNPDAVSWDSDEEVGQTSPKFEEPAKLGEKEDVNAMPEMAWKEVSQSTDVVNSTLGCNAEHQTMTTVSLDVQDADNEATDAAQAKAVRAARRAAKKAAAEAALAEATAKTVVADAAVAEVQPAPAASADMETLDPEVSKSAKKAAKAAKKAAHAVAHADTVGTADTAEATETVAAVEVAAEETLEAKAARRAARKAKKAEMATAENVKAEAATVETPTVETPEAAVTKATTAKVEVEAVDAERAAIEAAAAKEARRAARKAAKKASTEEGTAETEKPSVVIPAAEIPAAETTAAETAAVEAAAKEARRAARKASKARAATVLQCPGNVEAEQCKWDVASTDGGGGTSSVAGQVDPCGAPTRTCENFVHAKTVPSEKRQENASQPQNDLDGLLGDVLASTAPAKELVPGFQCTACDCQILRINNHVWGDVDYMFFRNNYPAYKKLKRQVLAQTDCCAYCCQCSWKSSDASAALIDVAEGLRWKVVG